MRDATSSNGPCASPAADGCCQSPSARFPALAELIGYLESIRARADLAVLSRLLGQIRVSRADIEPICTFGVRGYRRNTIARSDWFELLALCWRSGHCTPIHDHVGSSCAFRVVEGTGTEIRFLPTPSGLICPAETIRMAPGYVCAAKDEDIHQVANMQAAGQDLITLHIYSPPISKMRTYQFATSEGAETGAVYAGQSVVECAI
ncbi:MAG: cysteine dioxygenase family protein [Phycisphaerales bacterium]|nr:cysteine dioxygenase family protein [Phycisphaerales bacterium]